MKLAALFLGLALAAGNLLASTVTAVEGDVQLLRAGTSRPVTVGLQLQEGDELVSADAGEAVVRMEDGGRIALRPASRMLFRQLPAPGAADTAPKLVSLGRGALRYVSERLAGARSLRFETNTATIGIRGTDIEIALAEQAVGGEPPGTLLRVRTGVAVIRGSDGTEASVRAGQFAYGGEPDPPSRSIGTPQRPGARIVGNRAAAAFGGGRLDSALR
jgi:hypothetical protein